MAKLGGFVWLAFAALVAAACTTTTEAARAEDMQERDCRLPSRRPA